MSSQSNCLRMALVALVLLSIFPTSLFAANWANCGKEGKDCEIPDASDVMIRYGADGNFFYFGTMGRSGASCSNWQGDPDKGQDKACAFTADPVTFNWTKCVKEGKSCSAPDDPTWVRYGTGKKWLKTIQSGKFKCSNDWFGTDPVKGSDKECQLGGPVYTATNSTGAPKWGTCAAENNVCGITSTIPVLLRYGIGNDWTYRLALLDKIECSNGIFGIDPAKGHDKECQTSYMPVSAASTGSWAQVSSCTGPKCQVSHTVTVGTSQTQSSTTTDEWSQTVTVSMEGGFSIDGVGAKVSASVANQYVHSEAFQKSLTTSQSSTDQVTCGDLGTDEKRILYQFTTDTTQNCLLDGTCKGNTLTFDFVCAINPPATYNGPLCAPNDCFNALCDVCASSVNPAS